MGDVILNEKRSTEAIMMPAFGDHCIQDIETSGFIETLQNSVLTIVVLI